MTLTVGMCPKWGALSFSVTSKVYSLLVQAKRYAIKHYISLTSQSFKYVMKPPQNPMDS